MLPYWALFAYFALGAVLYRSSDARRVAGGPMLALGLLVAGLMIGLRHKVGADWDTYQFMWRYARYASYEQLLRLGDPAYQTLNYLTARADLSIHWTNFVCGAIFAWGLYRFVRQQPNPWLTALVAIPYLVIVVAMGYTRQATAIGFLLAGLAARERGASIARFGLYVLAAALFHRSAVVALPLVILSSTRNRLVNIVGGLAMFAAMFSLFLQDSMDSYVQNYIKAGYSSQGASIRVAMDVVPAVLFFLFGKKMDFSAEQRLIWRNFSIAALGALVFLMLSPSSTAVDRIALYLLPLQLAVLSRLPQSMATQGLGRAVVALFALFVQFAWLNFAKHAQYWLPYQFYPFT